jgi:hypothetical protein
VGPAARAAAVRKQDMIRQKMYAGTAVAWAERQAGVLRCERNHRLFPFPYWELNCRRVMHVLPTTPIICKDWSSNSPIDC